MDNGVISADIGRMRFLIVALTLTAFGSPAFAEDASIDRDDLDAAAGRALFQNSPLAVSIAATSKPSDTAAPPTVLRAGKPIRVVYPGPYSR